MRLPRNRDARYAVRFAIGCLVFIGMPEIARSLHGGAFAQQTLNNLYGNTVIGKAIIGNNQGGVAASFSATGSPGQTTPVIGGESNVKACPGQNAVGTLIIQNGPGTGMKVTAGGNGPAIGYRSTVTVGPCR